MSIRNYEEPTWSGGMFAAEAPANARVAFIRRTYANVLGAVVAFVLICAAILQTPLAETLTRFMFGGRFQGLMVFGAFMAATWAAQAMAANRSSVGLQYAGLALYTVAEALLFTPILLYAQTRFHSSDIIFQAGALTLGIFGTLSAVVMLTRQDFSFLRNILWLGGLAALGIMVIAMFGGLSLGTWFSAAMIVLMCGYILYETSNVLHHYQTDQHVAAALALFSSIATLFWYVLRLMMNSRND